MTPISVTYHGLLVDAEIPGERFLWATYEPFSLLWWQGTRIGTVRVGRHFATNFASVPRLLWPLVAPWDSHVRKAAVCHDLLYSSHEYSREFADALLFHGMVPLNAPRWKRWLVWLAVRLFGRRPWDNGAANQWQNIEAFNQLRVGAPLGTITICDSTLGYLIYDPQRNVEPTEYVTRRGEL